MGIDRAFGHSERLSLQSRDQAGVWCEVDGNVHQQALRTSGAGAVAAPDAATVAPTWRARDRSEVGVRGANHFDCDWPTSGRLGQHQALSSSRAVDVLA